MTKKEMAQEVQSAKNSMLSYVRGHSKDKKSQIEIVRSYIRASTDFYKEACHMCKVQKKMTDLYKAELAGRRAALKELQKK